MEEKNNLNIENENKEVKKKWSKKKKAGVFCLVIVLLAAITAFNFLIVAPTLYLSFKYHESPFKYRIDEICMPKLDKIPNFEVFSRDYDVRLSNFSLWYYSEEQQFKVVFNNINHEFVDTKQMEEVEQLAIKYLQSNIDARINGVALEEEHFLTFGNALVDEENIIDFMCTMSYDISIIRGEPYLSEEDKYAYPTIYCFPVEEKELDDLSNKIYEYMTNYPEMWKKCSVYSFVDTNHSLQRYTEDIGYDTVINNDRFGIPYSEINNIRLSNSNMLNTRIVKI